MSKKFKVVCIQSRSSTFLKVGDIYDANRIKYNSEPFRGNFNICTENGDENYGYRKDYFLVLPESPLTAKDMSMSEWLAVCCCANFGKVEGKMNDSNIDVWDVVKCTSGMKKSSQFYVYRVSFKKAQKDIEIEAIEEEMRKLADRLSKIKGE
jgi:hypothetical protein